MRTPLLLPPKRYFEKLLESSQVQAGQILFPKLEVAGFNKKGRSGGVDICYEPSVSDISKRRGFDFHVFTWDI